MQFKHPELLYALFLLLIPIVIHLFQLRKFKKEAFTNVAFLKEATLQTRKSSQIKKWLILCTRMLLLAALVFAFAQPFTTNSKAFKAERKTVIYLDNSFSMQVKGKKGELLKRAVQDIITNVPENEKIAILTNDDVYPDATIKYLKNKLLDINYSSNTLSKKGALLKCKSLLKGEREHLKNIVLISDFQEDASNLNTAADSLTNLYFVKLNSVNRNNVAIDSIYISETTPTNFVLKVILKNSGTPIEHIPVALYNSDKLIAKTSISLENKAETSFLLPVNQIINGKVTIDDANLQFDNSLYFNINKPETIHILSINGANDSFLKRLYTAPEFNYTATTRDQLNYNLIEKQNLIIVNELEQVPVTLASALKQYTNQGGTLIIIPPSTAINYLSYNQLLEAYNINFKAFMKSEKQITSINYSHPLYHKGVFEKQVENFQYPKANSFYTLSPNNWSTALQFEDGKPFLGHTKNTYLFTAALNQDNSSFKNSPLIVPTFYNIAKQSFKFPKLYYTIGNKNTFEIETKIKQDQVLSLVKDAISTIPKQQYLNNKVVVKTLNDPKTAGIYTIKNGDETIKNVSYNYNRSESDLTYLDLSSYSNATVKNSISEIFNTIKSDTKVNALWKWFAIFALALLIIEMLILKFFK